MKTLTFLLVLFVTNITFTQILTRQEIDEINDAVVFNCGYEYGVSTIIPFDRIEKTTQQYGFNIEDTNTLQDCFIFIAYTHPPEDEFNVYGLVGIYKNGSIIWKSNPIIKWEGLTQTSVPGIMDINRDGVIELIILCYSGQNDQVADVWILSWNGITGWFINGIDENGYSVISQGDANAISILDTNGDGVLDICMGDECYYWNGISYSSSEPYPEIVPKNKLTANASCIVAKEVDSYKYKYMIKNDISSLQKIVSFGLDNYSENINNFLAPEHWEFSVWGGSNFLLGHVELPVWNYPNVFINSTGELEGFSFSSTGIPVITNVYIQGYNTDPDLDEDKIKSNSFIANTLAASDPSIPFIPIAFLDTLRNYNTLSFEFNWITNHTTADKYDSLLNTAKTQLQQNNNNAARTTLQSVLQEVNIDSTGNLTSEAYALLRYNTEYLLEQIPQSSPNLLVTLTNSQGTQIPASNVKYYDTSWKDAVNNGDGTFTVITTKPTVSVRMFYEGANQTVNNVPAQNNTYTFQTVNAAVQLKNSLGNFIDVGTVQYYAEAWRTFGTTVSGVANKELLPINYSFRMTYEYGNIDKQQDISVNPTVVFQTVNAAVELRNSTGNLIDQGTVQYYGGAWRTFGTTQNGVAYKELLPKSYNFRMTYEYVPLDKQQDLSTNSTVTFSTVLYTVKVTNANNQPLAGANTKYYSVSWRDIGLTNVNGEATKELLPKNLSFRAISGSVSQDKQQDIGVNSLVEIQLNVP